MRTHIDDVESCDDEGGASEPGLPTGANEYTGFNIDALPTTPRTSVAPVREQHSEVEAPECHNGMKQPRALVSSASIRSILVWLRLCVFAQCCCRAFSPDFGQSLGGGCVRRFVACCVSGGCPLGRDNYLQSAVAR